MEQLRQIDQLLAQDDPVEPSPDFVARVMRQADAEKRVIHLNARKIVAWIALAAAIGFVVFLLFLYEGAHPAPGPISQKPPAEVNPPAPSKTPSVTAQKEPAAAPVLPRKPVQNPAAASTENLSPGDAELIAHLDELQDMDLIKDYDSLQDLDTALIATQTGQE